MSSLKCCMWFCSLFFSLPLIFTLVPASISHFLTAAIKFSCYSSNEIGLLCFLSLKEMYRLTAQDLEMQNFIPAQMKGWTYVRTYSVRTIFFKISWMHRLPNFLTHGAPLRALSARESSTIIYRFSQG